MIDIKIKNKKVKKENDHKNIFARDTSPFKLSPIPFPLLPVSYPFPLLDAPQALAPPAPPISDFGTLTPTAPKSFCNTPPVINGITTIKNTFTPVWIIVRLKINWQARYYLDTSANWRLDKILEVDPSGTQHQIRNAYKRAALKYHPDRVPATSPDRPARTKKFQQINDAYYVLSDPQRRREYDDARRSSHSAESSWTSAHPPPESESFASDQFGTMFEEMLREERMAAGDETGAGGGGGGGYFWSVVGGLSGAAIGFIVANFPGAVAGGVAGNRLGAVRDKKGKSVYEVFQELPQEDKARVLGRLAARVLQSAVS
ncbi:hypothetical protein LOZ12_006306 [Ophidiomyces ophidiicola]|uniref:Uncharacterized protein n=1 Tax=Ophidiomyces ophidiicola TaxID=1387563 RepID=A0ACB8UTJ3_9EURO|nr:uncharacterized protein LOZ57_006360 [Ophidiomyces ophidiicola]KAI1906451.1 hypothetical protein LOZ64_006262 [Ophidiomyces ophidiicola]KAI1906501.1 hypothetical protein LOZ61_006644 [Ophidiomyces ophidiicola]KAI1938397.1 hypothetical protein LOZ57_006360 [Ophidiomyces ophidiicola]KAI1964206.1 hypothetical protein LOZ56_006295 [Ophidiomyces ophidiicola]KAI2002326.1 hypothetical protein LOZ49_006345 [Ophidiomyces ophidiicola]